MRASMRRSSQPRVVTEDEFEELLAGLSTPHALETLSFWDRPAEEVEEASDSEASGDDGGEASGAAAEVFRLRRALAEGGREALAACGLGETETTDEEDASVRGVRSRRRKRELRAAREGALARLEAAVAAFGFYVAGEAAGVDDDGRAELAVAADASFWLRLGVASGLALRVGSMKKALRRGSAVNVVAIERCLAATAEDAARLGMAGDASYARAAGALSALQRLRVAAAAAGDDGVDVDVGVGARAAEACCGLMDYARDAAPAASPAAGLALQRLAVAAVSECYGGARRGNPRRFDVGVLEGIPERHASTLWVRFERRSLVQKNELKK